MEKRDKYAMIAIAVCFSALGFAAGYFIFGPIGTIWANAGAAAVEPPATQYENFDGLPAAVNDDMPHTSTEAHVFAPRHQYVVTARDGYIVVLAAGKTGDEMRTVTDISISSLPAEEQARLANGIYIYDEHALFRILEDYGS